MALSMKKGDLVVRASLISQNNSNFLIEIQDENYNFLRALSTS